MITYHYFSILLLENDILWCTQILKPKITKYNNNFTKSKS